MGGRENIMEKDTPARLLDGIDTPAALRALPREALRQVADEVRGEVIDVVSRTGGHLGAGLGVVELTVALHYIFETPKCKIIWDVSHQCYPHKVLTGRMDRMPTLRQGGGLSGFTNRSESEYDCFGAAHSSTSISAGLGFAIARDYDQEDHAVIAVIGDGAASGGMAFEGLNHAGALKSKLIIILNDNNMSIAPPAGALSHYLTDLRAKLPDTDTRRAALAREPLPRFVEGDTLWDHLGVTYAGPFDGHDVEEMATVLERAKAADGPVLIHVATVKGKGYAPAEASTDCYHGVAKFDVESGKQHKPAPNAPSYPNVFAKAMIAHADRDPKIVAVTPAMPDGSGLTKFMKVHPDKCFDVAIAEQHAITFCAGLAADGYKPFAAVYSTFLQRGYDQVIHDVAIQQLPVRFAIDRAGMVGADGVTHQGAYDIAYLGCLPGFVLMAAADEAELMHMVATAVEIDDRPSAFRYPRGEGVGIDLPEIGTPLEVGRGRIIREGTDAAILTYGTRLYDALKAAEQLQEMGVSVTVADARFAKPLDEALVNRLLKEHPVLVSVEEGSQGGFATAVMHALTARGVNADLGRFFPMTLPDIYIDHGKPADQVALAGLDAKAIAARVLQLTGREVLAPVAAL